MGLICTWSGLTLSSSLINSLCLIQRSGQQQRITSVRPTVNITHIVWRYWSPCYCSQEAIHNDSSLPETWQQLPGVGFLSRLPPGNLRFHLVSACFLSKPSSSSLLTSVVYALNQWILCDSGIILQRLRLVCRCVALLTCVPSN